MVKYYRTDDKKIYEVSELTQGIWIDMVNPTVSEGEEVAEKLNIDIQDLLAALDEEESSRVELEDGYTLILIDIPTTEIRHDKEAYTTLKVSMNFACRLRSLCALCDSPCSCFIFSRCKETYQS